jgi:hypothetical protein
MNYDGCKRKFSIAAYVAANPRLSASSSSNSSKPFFSAK